MSSDSPERRLPLRDDREAQLSRLLNRIADLPTDRPLSCGERLSLLIAMIPDRTTGKPYTQTELAVKTGIDRKSINKIVNEATGMPTTPTLAALADAFEVPLDFFTKPDLGAVLRQELQALGRVAHVAQGLKEFGELSANFRPAAPTVDPSPAEVLGLRAEQLARDVGDLAQDPENLTPLDSTLAALESMIQVLRSAQDGQGRRRRRTGPKSSP